MSGVIQEYNFTSEDAKSLSNKVLNEVQVLYMAKWDEIVSNKLKKQKQPYLDAMKVYRPDDYSVVFVLEGKETSRVALMIERGASAFDEKIGFENSPKKKAKKDGGWFLTIPFRIATAEALADSPIFQGQLTKEMQKIAKPLQGKEQLTKNNVPIELQNYGERKELSNYPKYEHKSFDFQGLRHDTKENHGHYEMFRRVSDESDPNSWIHPGFEAHNFMEKALQEIQIEKIYEKTRDEFLAERE